MGEATRMKIERLEGRCIGLTVALATFVRTVGSKEDVLTLVNAIASDLDTAAHRYTEPDSAHGQGIADTRILLRDVVGRIDPA